MTVEAEVAVRSEWSDLWPHRASTRGRIAAIRGTAKPGVALLHIYSKVQGYLNAEARGLLFGDSKHGWIRFQRSLRGGVSLVAMPVGEGYRVGRSGHVNCSAITDLVGRWPLTYRLNPSLDEPHRLLFGERIVASQEPSA